MLLLSSPFVYANVLQQIFLSCSISKRKLKQAKPLFVASTSYALSFSASVCVCISPQFFFLTLMKSELFIILYSFVRWLVGFVHSLIRCVLCSVFGLFFIHIVSSLAFFCTLVWSSCRTTHTHTHTQFYNTVCRFWLAGSCLLAHSVRSVSIWCVVCTQSECICISEFFFFLFSCLLLVDCCVLLFLLLPTRLIYTFSKYSKYIQCHLV